ncbi:GNAT family N-acetyltransferase [Dyella flava]|uniref:GNAT family N-acetyltransferase n=1 Tax=Dyella flava TaxID=1920170 RepID=A0ABS2K7F4_9GAMM|nr:GNAT family N-acetyltransferase [Dyella flava]MBM7127142.1 GNAT family N-acetyltransferase [Dyella flava]GLQ50096.1 acetyltransferase [Dyella flava]
MSEQLLRIRLARPEDAPAVATLIRRVVRRWVLPDQPRKAGQAFLLRITTRFLREKIVEGQRFYLGYLGDVLVGVSGMRDDCHLVHFFVSTRYQGRGISRRLWQRTMRDAVRRAGTRRFTLNATRCGVPIYLRFGFRATGPEQISHNGLRVTPMKMILPATRGKRA